MKLLNGDGYSTFFQGDGYGLGSHGVATIGTGTGDGLCNAYGDGYGTLHVNDVMKVYMISFGERREDDDR